MIVMVQSCSLAQSCYWFLYNLLQDSMIEVQGLSSELGRSIDEAVADEKSRISAMLERVKHGHIEGVHLPGIS